MPKISEFYAPTRFHNKATWVSLPTGGNGIEFCLPVTKSAQNKPYTARNLA